MSIEDELKDAVAGIARNFEEFSARNEKRFAEERGYREDLERKLNLQRLSGNASTERMASEAPHALFMRSVKSWNPARAIDLNGFDYGDYRKSFSKYVRFGLDVLDQHERKQLQAGIDPDGGFLAPSEMASFILRSEGANSVMRSVARLLPMGLGDLDVPASLTRPAVGWVSEVGARNDTSTPSIGMLSFTAKELYCQPKATQKILDDSSFDIEAFLGEEVGLALAEEEDEKFIAGDGIVAPRGFTTYTTAATADASRAWGTIQHIATGVAGDWPATDAALYDKLIDAVHALRPAYRKNAKWVMPTAAISRLRKMKTATTSEPIWQPSVQLGEPDRLLGFEVVEAEQMPAIAANSLSVAFADWRRAYWILDRAGVRILRDPYTDKPYVKFYTTKRLTGGMADSCAIKLLKFSVS